MGAKLDFETVLPMALGRLFRWTAGFLIAGCWRIHVELRGHGERRRPTSSTTSTSATSIHAKPQTYVRWPI